MSSSTRSATVGLGLDDGGEVQRGGERVAHVDAALERDRDRLGDGERGEEATVLERAAEPELGAGLRGRAGDVVDVALRVADHDRAGVLRW